jgi:hypothetical protein
VKKAKFDFGEGGLQGFCIRHVEKFVLGVVAVLLVGFLYMGMQAPALESTKSPDGLATVVKNAENTLNKTKWDEVKVEKESKVKFTTEKDVLDVQAPVDASGYPIVQIINRPPYPRLRPRTDPKILAPVNIRVTPYYGALHVGEGEDPQSSLSPVAAVGGGRRRLGEGTYKPDQPSGAYKSSNMVVITAAVPYGKQSREYETAFANSPDYRLMDRDDVQYLWATLERAEVQADSDVPKKADWKPISKSADWQKYAAIVGEATQDASVDSVTKESRFAITQPVPPLLNTDLTAALAHPDIPLRKPVDPNKVGLPAPVGEEAEEGVELPPDAGEMPEDTGDAPAGDEPPDSTSLLDRALEESYTVTARQLPTMRQGKKPKPGKPGKFGKTGSGMGSMMPGPSGGSPTGSMGGSGGPPGSSGGMMGMPGPPTGSMGGSGGPPGSSGGMMPGMGAMQGMQGMMGMQGMKSGMQNNILGLPGALNQQRHVVPWKLVRFVDATAEPGKKYKYRIRVSIHDPNRPRAPIPAPESNFLAVDVKERLRKLDEQDKKAKAKEPTYWRNSDYSEASSAVSLPQFTTVLASGTTGQSNVTLVADGRELDCPAGDQTLTVLAISWDKDYATHVPGETAVTHGSVMYFNKKALTKDESNKERPLHILNPLAGDLRVVKNDYTWKSPTQVLDIQGGVTLKGISRGSGARTPKSASEALLVDESGNLVVIDELASFKAYGEFTYAGDADAGAGTPQMQFGEPSADSPYGPPSNSGGFNLGPPSGDPGKARPSRK